MRMIAMAWVLAACSGPETQVRNRVPVIGAAPELLQFGDVGPPLTVTQQIYVTNSGGATLEIDDVALQGGQGGFQLDLTPFSLEPEEERALDVVFAPDTFEDYSARVVFTSNDPDRPTVAIPLTGRGVDLPFPDIAILPSATVSTAEIVPIGETETMSFEIHNLGDAELNLGQITVADPYGAPVPQFVEVYGQSGNVVLPDQYALVVFYYTPDDEEADLGIVEIPSDDPDEPEVTVQLNGNGAIELPEAVIDCPSEVLLTGPEWVHLSGADSYDPAGYALAYAWTPILRPDAADEDIPFDPSNTEEVDLYVDVAGTWSIELRVQNELGAVSEPKVCEFEAIPEDDLHVELSWATASADIDLHLVQGGAALWNTPEDCSWCNRTPDWGVAGSDDDPRLDIDDEGGYGPENINILHPEDGTYEVKVHYFAQHGDGPVVATVHVWLDGAEVYTASQVLVLDEVWNVGVADWPSALFVPDGTIGTTARDTCQ